MVVQHSQLRPISASTGYMIISELQADLAAEEAAATEAALRKRGQNVDDMEASIGRREAALGEAAAKLGAKGVSPAIWPAGP